jgi:pimeloyl-ACP methyl ester carboxylesterase
MKKETLKIENIPATLWGEQANKLIIAVHGDMSHKEDDVIAIFAECAASKGYRVMSFDLPEHGDRSNTNIPCKVQNCVQDLKTVMDYGRGLSENIGVFACSIGAYFSLLAYKNVSLRQALFLSPVVDMERIIYNMMSWFGISEDKLKTEKEIVTPIGHTLYWDYFTYVKDNPILTWNTPTAILYGAKDNTCELETVISFAERFKAALQVMEQGEHYFHTEEQLAFFKQWCNNSIKAV